ncbi:hypothetical protein FACS18949_10200 [Clostridia bacterium]|nr:hypothetical protein FACS189425_09870 [Clostridia bacterium]GHV34339.1 hypothetical protein FACS18949_10200 [Clostridia bacterium]
MGWIIAAAVFLLVMFTRVGAHAYFGTELRVYAVVGFFKLKLLPARPRKLKKAAKIEESAEPPKPETPKDETPKVKAPKAESGSKFDFKPFLPLIPAVLKKLLRLPRFDIIEVKLLSASDMADKAALLYGRMWTAIGAATPFLRKFLRIGRYRVGADLSFTRSKPEVSGQIKVTVSVGGALLFALWAGYKFLVTIRKGGKNNGEQVVANDVGGNGAD